ncbi:MAG: outer membrane protein assembly factor BamE [Candidatus Obscuribacter sp.]|nr:outer membrane protein assembly factor BamE [Candidatus Obscuribacter sp.]
MGRLRTIPGVYFFWVRSLVAFERNFEKLTPGMTKEQVTQLLGTPTTKKWVC